MPATDPVEAGVAAARQRGYGSHHEDEVRAALRVAESDEESGWRSWRTNFPHDPDTFAVLLGAVRAEARSQARRHAWEREQATAAVLHDVSLKRTEQVMRYGLNLTTPDGTGGCWLAPYTNDSATTIEVSLRDDYMDFAEDGEGPVTWVHLLREEVAEAFAASDDETLYAELMDVAALAVSWGERIRARSPQAVTQYQLDRRAEADERDSTHP